MGVLSYDREAGIDRFRLRVSASGSGCANGHSQPHGLAHNGARLQPDRRLLLGEHMPRLSQPRLPDVQGRQAELRRGGGGGEEVCSQVMPLEFGPRRGDSCPRRRCH